MRKHHPKNERIKRRYLAYLEEAKRMSQKTTDQVAASLALFEVSDRLQGFCCLSHRTGAQVQTGPSGPDQPGNRQAFGKGNDPFPADGAEGLLPLARWPAGLQILDQLF
jgi:hypothetical protein